MTTDDNQSTSFELEQPGPNFVKYGNPFSETNRGFLYLKSSGFDALEVCGTALRMVKHFKVCPDAIQVKSLRTTEHENLVNLKEVFLAEDAIFFIYDDWGIPVDRICSVFHIGEVEVATICKGVCPDLFLLSKCLEANMHQVLQGLVYLHEVLDIGHGAIYPSNILIMPDGGVKIGQSSPAITGHD
jgi:serine/threonine protein kinase